VPSHLLKNLAILIFIPQRFPTIKVDIKVAVFILEVMLKFILIKAIYFQAFSSWTIVPTMAKIWHLT